MKKVLILTLLLLLILPSTTFSAVVPSFQCPVYTYNNSVPWFDNYQNHLYKDGFLNIQFQLINNEFNEGQNVILPTISLFNQNCEPVAEFSISSLGFQLPAGTKNFSLRFISSTHFMLWNDDTDSYVYCPGCDVDFSYLPFGDNLKASFFVQAGAIDSWVGSDTFNIVNHTRPHYRTPIVIVPGVLGTEMLKGNEVLWADISRMSNPANLDGFMDPLMFQQELTPLDYSVVKGGVITKKSSMVLGKELTLFDYTQGLLTTLTSQGYTEGTDLFTFPYDWRYGVSGKEPDGTTNVDHLKGQIEYILNQTEAGRNAGKVNVIAHSTGGLLVKKYVMDNPASHHIDKAVFVGVPNTGAPKAIKVLTVGDGFGIIGLVNDEMKKISKNLPVVYDLAPSRTYFDKKGSFYRIVQTNFLSPISATNKELGFNETWQHLNSSGITNSVAIENTQQLHSLNFDNFDLRSVGVDIYNIVGCKENTIGQIVEEQYQGLIGQRKILYKKPTYAPGDGTVPLESATNVPVDAAKKYYALKADHSSMMSQDGIKEQITNILTGSSLPVGSVITQDIAQCKLNGKAYAVYSPINFQVTDALGNSLGIAEDGSTYNSIPNASLDVFGEHKFMYLPEEGDFNIQLKGTATGTFTFISQDINDSQSAEARVFSNLPVTTKLVATVQEQAGGGTNLLLDTNGDGSVDKAATPSAILNAEQAQDVLAPVSTSTLSGLMGEPGFYRSSVKLTLSAEDSQDQNNPEAASGVLGISYSLDGQATTTMTTYPTSLTVTAEGLHTLTFFATDKAGNNEEPKTLEFVIDATAPELIMQFSPKDQDLVFTATDTLATVLTSTTTTKQLKYKHPKISETSNTITATDSAGNVTVLTFQGKDRKRNLSADIKSLTYNGIAANLSKTQLHFDWLFDKKGNVLLLTQQVKSKKDFDILGLYALGKTTLVGKDQGGKIKKILSGLILLKVSTQKGDLVWGY